MINSRKIDDLLPAVRDRASMHIACCAQHGVELLITSTYRDVESQNALYELGRTKPGHIVTNAKGNQSFHQFRCAYDVVPLVHGKPLWKVFDANGILLPEWKIVVDCGKQAELEWAGDWISFKEEAHFQYTGGLTLAQLQNGMEIA